MTKAEMEALLEKKQKEEFYLQMKDHWSDYDFTLDRSLRNEIVELKKQIEEAEE